MFIHVPQATGTKMGLEHRFVNARSVSLPSPFFLKKSEMEESQERRQNCVFHWDFQTMASGVWVDVTSHSLTFPQPRKQISHWAKEEEWGVEESFLLSHYAPHISHPHLLDQISYIDPAFLNTSRPPEMGRRIYTEHWQNKMRSKDRDTHGYFL